MCAIVHPQDSNRSVGRGTSIFDSNGTARPNAPSAMKRIQHRQVPLWRFVLSNDLRFSRERRIRDSVRTESCAFWPVKTAAQEVT
jgi:hypothetical protein